MARRAPGEGAVFHSAAKGCWIWRAVVGTRPDGKVRYREGRARTRAEAVRKQQAAERAGAGPAAGASATVGEWLDAWLPDHLLTFRESSGVGYVRTARVQIAPRVGGVRLAALTAADVTRAWADMAREGYKPGTIKFASQVLSLAMAAAVKAGRRADNPCKAALRPKVERPAVEVFSDAEVGAILAACRGRPLGAFFVLAAATGMRAGELCALRWEDVAADASAVHVRRTVNQSRSRLGPPKSPRGVRVVTLPDFARDALLPLKASGKGGEGWVFSNGRGPAWPSSVYRCHYRPLVADAGVPYRPIHTFRHTHASRLLAAGVPVPEVARRLGDAEQTVISTYAHWMPSGDTAAKVQAIYGGATFAPPSPGDAARTPPGRDAAGDRRAA